MEEKKKCILPHRRQIRLLGYDYAQQGQYFVTICTQQRICQFGKIIDNEMIVNDAGQMVQQVWENLPERFSNVMLDIYQIMPNHIHGIIVVGAPLVGALWAPVSRHINHQIYLIL